MRHQLELLDLVLDLVGDEVERPNRRMAMAGLRPGRKGLAYADVS